MKNKVYNGKIGVKNGEKIIEWDFFSRKNKAKKPVLSVWERSERELN